MSDIIKKTDDESISILFGSDFHFGIPTISQEEMANSFAAAIFPLLEKTDIFFINGDFFHTIVQFDHFGFDPVYDTILVMFSLCEKHRVKLRILQGTWMHDRNQLKRLTTFYRNAGYTFDFQIVMDISLEEIEINNRKLKIAYVPDDLPFKSSDDIVDVVKNKMTELGWDYLDYACMHGFFDFTFPKAISQDKCIVFKESQFDFVKKMIDVGHVHQNRTSGKVISNGSFDRLCYGDEEPKGVIWVIDHPETYTAQFIENKDTAVFDTLYFTKNDTTESIRERVTAHLASISSKRKISLRCAITSVEHKEAIRKWMKEVYPQIDCKIKMTDDEDEVTNFSPTSDLFTEVQQRIAPTPATIAAAIRAHIPEDYELSIEEIEVLLQPISDK